MADPVDPDQEAADEKAKLKAMISGLGAGTGAPGRVGASNPQTGTAAAPRPGGGFQIGGAPFPSNGDSYPASAARNLGGASTPGAGAASAPQPLRRFPGVMQGDQQGSPFLRRSIGGGMVPPTTPPAQLTATPQGARPVINLPKGTGQIPATATMFLFIALALVTMWPYVFKQLIQRATTGNVAPITAPPSSIISLLLFGVILVFVSELSPTAAQFTALFMFALWAVFLVMNPSVVTTFAGWVSQSNQAVATAPQSQAQQASNKGA